MGSGEVSATIMALESAAALAVFYVVVDVFVGGMFGGANVVVGDNK